MKHSSPALRHLHEELASLEAAGLLRVRPSRPAADVAVFCSNDYLGLGGRTVCGAAGAGAARLVSGDRQEHQELESAVADWLRCDSAIAFVSGYAANVGALSALVGEGDFVVSDALNHASIIDGLRLARGRVRVVPHLDTGAVAEALASGEARAARRRWVVTESYFSMDADSPDLGELRTLCDRAQAGLYVDEAHALGVLGPEGRGLCAEAQVVPDVLVGTFGKALGASGAFVAGAEALTMWLWNRARSFVFSTGMSPVVALAATDAVKLVRATPELRNRTLAVAAQMREGLGRLGRTALGWAHIVPCLVGDPRKAVALADGLRERGVWTVAIRPPSVPVGTARLRLTASAATSGAEVERLLGALHALRQL